MDKNNYYHSFKHDLRVYSRQGLSHKSKVSIRVYQKQFKNKKKPCFDPKNFKKNQQVFYLCFILGQMGHKSTQVFD
jgi:hypothetical protein